MNAEVHARRAHAVLNLGSRNQKALKIERLLDLEHRAQPIAMLEIGTGSGGIAHYFGTHPSLRCNVSAADVRDNRQITEGFSYQPVSGTRLPFEAASFDVVISNHVIEHVGNAAAQHQHLVEIHRVMNPGGVGYLAVPNRWMLREPHYRLLFLSWWPRPLRTPYLRMMRKGSFYDCEPLQMHQLEHMLAAAGFHYQNICIEALRATLDIEGAQSTTARILHATPDTLLRPFRRIIPTLIYRIERAK